MRVREQPAGAGKPSERPVCFREGEHNIRSEVKRAGKWRRVESVVWEAAAGGTNDPAECVVRKPSWIHLGKIQRSSV